MPCHAKKNASICIYLVKAQANTMTSQIRDQGVKAKVQIILFFVSKEWN